MLKKGAAVVAQGCGSCRLKVVLAVISRDYVTASGPTRPSLSLTDRALAGHAAVRFNCQLVSACSKHACSGDVSFR